MQTAYIFSKDPVDNYSQEVKLLSHTSDELRIQGDCYSITLYPAKKYGITTYTDGSESYVSIINIEKIEGTPVLIDCEENGHIYTIEL